MQCVQNLITERVVVFSLSGGLTCSPLTMCDVDTSVAMHYYPHPICAPRGCIHHSSLSVYPRQQSSEHLAIVTQQHTFTRLIGSSPWQVNVPYISISNKIQLYFPVTCLSGALVHLFISASQHHWPDHSPPSSQQSANFGEILPSWDWQYKVYIVTFYTTWFHTSCQLELSIQILGGSSIPGSHEIITFTALVNSHELKIFIPKTTCVKWRWTYIQFPSPLNLIMKNLNQEKKEIRKEI